MNNRGHGSVSVKCVTTCVKLYDERYVLLVRQVHLLPLPETIVYRKGIYGHRQMLRVNLREAFPAGIVSGERKCEQNCHTNDTKSTMLVYDKYSA